MGNAPLDEKQKKLIEQLERGLSDIGIILKGYEFTPGKRAKEESNGLRTTT